MKPKPHLSKASPPIEGYRMASASPQVPRDGKERRQQGRRKEAAQSRKFTMVWVQTAEGGAGQAPPKKKKKKERKKESKQASKQERKKRRTRTKSKDEAKWGANTIPNV